MIEQIPRLINEKKEIGVNKSPSILFMENMARNISHRELPEIYEDDSMF
jgi:hypothetical protein